MLNDLLFFAVAQNSLLVFIMMIFGVLIIPKWLINYFWSIAIFFGTFLERPKLWPNPDPRTPYLSPKFLTKYKNSYGDIFENNHILYSAILKMLGGPSTSLFEILQLRIFDFCTFENWTLCNLKTDKVNTWNFKLDLWKLEIWTI